VSGLPTVNEVARREGVWVLSLACSVVLALPALRAGMAQDQTCLMGSGNAPTAAHTLQHEPGLVCKNMPVAAQVATAAAGILQFPGLAFSIRFATTVSDNASSHSQRAALGRAPPFFLF